jgi:AraC-like DNA-binding protein
MAIGNMPYLFSNFQQKENLLHRFVNHQVNFNDIHVNIFIPDGWGLMLRFLIFFSYNLAALLLFTKNKEIIKKRMELHGFIFPKLNIYIRVFLICSLFFRFFLILYWGIQVSEKFNPLIYSNNTVSVFEVILGFYFGLSFFIFFIPELLFGLPLRKKMEHFTIANNLEKKLPNETAANPLHKFTDEYIRELDEKIMQLLDNKIYLNPEFTHTNFAGALDIPAHHLTYYFNHYLKQKFTDWRNRLRIIHATELIHNNKELNLPLSDICKRCGFSNQTTFIAAFRKEFNITPGEYERTFRSSDANTVLN